MVKGAGWKRNPRYRVDKAIVARTRIPDCCRNLVGIWARADGGYDSMRGILREGGS
jgi:hypothetical protein